MNSSNSVPLSFEALEDGLSISFSEKIGEIISYRINGGAWGTLLAEENTEEVNKGAVISFQYAKSINGDGSLGNFFINKKCNVFGVCSSIIPKVLGEKYMGEMLFSSLFYNCDVIVDASKLELPATTLAFNCYSNMFRGCRSLVKAPVLPASTLTSYCYSSMFYNCINLRYIKMLATDISAGECLYRWTYGVPYTGIFIKHPEMNSLPSGYSGIPNGWAVYDAYLGSGLEFPLRLNFDGYDVGAMEAYRHADSTSKMLAGYLAEILGTHGEYNGAFEVNSEILNKLGVEIYIDDVKVISLDAVQNDGFSLLYLSPESDIPMGNSGFKCTTVRIDNTGYITGDLEW